MEPASAGEALPRLFTVDDILRMVEVGILQEDEHVELLDGELLAMSPQGPAHSALTVFLHERLMTVYGGRAHIRDHSNIYLDLRNLPEPDLAVVRGDALDYIERLPTGSDLVLIVEIAVTSQHRDQRKIATYARGGVGAYWILDVPARTLAVFDSPDAEAGTYRTSRVLGSQEMVTVPETDTAWRVGELLGEK